MYMKDTIPMPEQEAQTVAYLKTNGPPEGAFKPDVPEYALEGASKRDRYLLEMVSILAKQNEWQIKEIVGLKGAHRIIHRRLEDGEKRFDAIEQTMAFFVHLKEKWLSRRKTVRNVVIGLFTLFLLPFLSLFMVEVMKRILHWN